MVQSRPRRVVKPVSPAPNVSRETLKVTALPVAWVAEEHGAGMFHVKHLVHD
jgi:hypothetical protein